MKKRGQQTTSMPFGMIFSIFLIVVFIVFAFIAVKYLLGIGGKANVGLFYRELQDEVNDAWKSQSTDNKIFKINLNPEIEKVCFANLSAEITGSREVYRQIEIYEVYEANTFLIPPEKAEGLEYKLIKHLDIPRITREKNPYCVDASGSLKIKKDFNDKLVLIE